MQGKGTPLSGEEEIWWGTAKNLRLRDGLGRSGCNGVGREGCLENCTTEGMQLEKGLQKTKQVVVHLNSYEGMLPQEKLEFDPTMNQSKLLGLVEEEDCLVVNNGGDMEVEKGGGAGVRLLTCWNDGQRCCWRKDSSW